MKKLLVVAFAAVLTAAFVIPASAVENSFGGYWRTRAYTQQDFDGTDTDDKDLTRVDTRSRLFYTAKLNDNLTFKNAFEFNAVWGDDNGGDIGTDGDTFRVKHSYADFNFMDLDVKLGMQGLVLQRGFLFDDDYAGANIAYSNGAFTLPIVWAKVDEGMNSVSSTPNGENDEDVDLYVLYPQYQISDNMVVKGLIGYLHESDADTDIYYVGVDFDATFDAAKVWFSGIYGGGDKNDTEDLDGYLLAGGGSYDFGGFGLHGQVFFATGDEADSSDDDSFLVPAGQSYYWSEIMGLGTFDSQASINSPGGGISNILAFNVGVSAKPMDKLKLSADLWYAELDQKVDGEDELGTEIDLKATYQLIEGLNLDVIAAYLFAGDATSVDGSNDEDPYEIGTRLSLSF